jgi:hypothetical protein
MKHRLIGTVVAAALSAAAGSAAFAQDKDKGRPAGDRPVPLSDVKVGVEVEKAPAKAEPAKVEKKDPPKKKDPARVLPGPIPQADVQALLRGVTDLGFTVDDPAVVNLLARVAEQPVEPFRLDENELPVAFTDLLERPSEFRGKLVGVDGSMIDAKVWTAGDGRKVFQALLQDARGNAYTVLLPADPGYRNARVRLRAYFVRYREFDISRRPSPVLVGRAWDKIEVAPPTEAAKSGPDFLVGSDGRPLAPSEDEIWNMESDLKAQDHKDPRTDTDAMFRALRWASTLSADAYQFKEEDLPPVSFKALTEHPGTYMGHLVTIEGVVRSIQMYPDPGRRSGLDKYWVAVVSQSQARAYLATVVLATDPGPFVGPFEVKFKSYMIKIREFEVQGKDADRRPMTGYGPVLVARSWTVTQGPVSLEPTEPTWLKTVMGSKFAWWIFIGLAVALLGWAYVARRAPLAQSTAMARLAPAEPLTSREVIESLKRMPNQPRAGAEPTGGGASASSLAEMPETKPIDEPAPPSSSRSPTWPPGASG